MHGKSSHELSESEVRDLALRYLSRREYGIEELKRKLIRRGAEPDRVEDVVSRLEDQDLVSDERFTQMYVRTRIRRLFGPLKIRAELRQRGVADGPVQAAMPADEEAWFGAAEQWAQKRCRSALDYAERARIYRSLVSRGFTREQANVALDRLISS